MDFQLRKERKEEKKLPEAKTSTVHRGSYTCTTDRKVSRIRTESSG